jgi:hypothetical protein
MWMNTVKLPVVWLFTRQHIYPSHFTMQDSARIRNAFRQGIEDNSYSGENAPAFSINTIRVALLSKSITMYKMFLNQPRS